MSHVDDLVNVALADLEIVREEYPGTAEELREVIVSLGGIARRAEAMTWAGHLWSCGHHHPTRGEAVACKRRQAGAFC